MSVNQLRTSEQLRSESHALLDRVDQRLLAAVHALLQTHDQYQPLKPDEEAERRARVEAYEASLTPMSVEELVARSPASDADIAAGRLHTLEEVAAHLGIRV